MVLGSKKLSHLITKFERGGGASAELPTSPRRQRKRLKKLINIKDVEIGDKINLFESPWKDCEGMYPCKAISRPVFAESAMVAFAGAAGARAVAQSAKQHVMIVDRHLVEFTKLNETNGRDEINKMRVRREEELIALFFKSGPDNPLILKCRECTIVSQQIRAAKGSGMVKKEAIHKALHLIQEIQAQERALEYQPSLERVNEITSLYDKAVQQFVIAKDVRHEEVLELKRKFLALPKVASIRKGAPQKPRAGLRREPEILETSVDYLDNDVIRRLDSDEGSQNWADFGNMESQKAKGEQRMESNEVLDDILFEARQDFDAFNLGNELDPDTDRDGHSFVIAEFDAMMDAAERELDEIRKM